MYYGEKGIVLAASEEKDKTKKLSPKRLVIMSSSFVVIVASIILAIIFGTPKDDVQKYSINFVGNSEVIYNENQKLGTLPTIEKEGYDFLGWYVGETLLQPDTIYTFSGDVIATPKYQVKTFSIDFYADGEKIYSKTVEYGDSLVESDYPTLPEKTGYNGCWDIIGLSTVKENKQITAQYFVDRFQVVYKDFDGTLINIEYVDINQNATYSTIPTRTGYTFTNWDKSLSKITQNTIVTAEYTIKSFKVELFDGNTLYQTYQEEYGTSITLPSLSKYGYSFNGFVYSNTTYENSYTVVDNVILVASYTQLPTHTLSFDCNGGDPLANQTQIESYIIASLPTPIRTDYIFNGWYYGLTKITAPFQYNYTEDITLSATWISLSDVWITANDDDNSLIITGVKNTFSEDTAIIPMSIDGKNVCSIAANAFSNNATIKTLRLQNNIKTIGNGAFSYMTSLENIYFGNQITSYGTNLLLGCNNIKLIEIAPNITFNLSYLFGGNSANVPTTIGTISFTDIGSNEFTVYKKFFNSLSWPVKVIMPEGPTSIEIEAFSDLSTISTVEISSTVREIQMSAFLRSSITEIFIPATVTTLGQAIFSNCAQLTKVTFAENSPITEIEYGDFFECRNLIQITLPPHLTTIWEEAFIYCGLTELDLSTVTFIGQSAFSDCAFTTVYLGSNVTEVQKDAFFRLNPVSATIYVQSSGPGEDWATDWHHNVSNVVWNYTPGD